MDPSINSASFWKLPYLAEQLQLLSFVALIAITETWLKEHITDAQILLPDYQILRSDRKNRGRGGTLLYIHNNFPTTNVVHFDDSICEAVICNVDSLNYIVASIYRPPNTDNESFNKMLNLLQSHINKQTENNKHKNILIVGDFNLPHLTWSNTPSAQSSQYTTPNNSDCAKTLRNFMDKNFLSQYIEEPTRLHNILDLVLTNDVNLVKQVDVQDTGLSDHRLINIQSSFGVKPNPTPKKVFTPHTFRNLNLYKADFEQINQHLKTVDWKELHSLCESKDYPELVRLIILQVCELYSPTKCYRSKSNRLSAYRRERRATNRKIRKLRNVLVEKNLDFTSQQKIKEKITKHYDSIKDSVKNEAKKSEQEAISKIKENPKYFFSWSKRKLKYKTSVGPLVDSTGNLQHDEKIMADILQTQFCSVFSDPNNPSKKLTNINVNYDKPLENIPITVEDIDKALKSLNINSSAGDDDIPAIVLKKCSTTLNLPLLLIWKESLETGFIHPRFKEQTIAPIHKKGSKSLPANYRPISPTSHSIKTCEKIVKDKILDHFTRNNLMCKHQHGFLPNRSCLTQLLSHINLVLENFLKGHDTDSIYLDYAKAFDKVDHEILIHKLQCYGIHGNLLQWIKEFLRGRTQSVVVNGVHSYRSGVKSGVPQGTVLGPLLFLIYINDINKCITESFISCFADDTRIKKSIAFTSDVDDLQRDLNYVIQWSTENNMVLHQDKFEYINHSTGEAKLLQNLPFTSEYYQYTTPNGSTITPTELVKDLGVTISSDLSWGPHIDNITDSARKMCSWILSVFESRDETVMMTLYKSLVRSRLEYCSALWSSGKVEDIMKIEAIQRMFTSKINGYSDLEYWDRLKYLKLMSLQRRRERYIILHLYKILHNSAPNDINIKFTTHQRRGTLAEVPKLSKSAKQRFQSMYDSSFAVQGPRLWNTLPVKIRELDSFGSFKAALTRHMLAVPDQPPIPGIASGNSMLQWTGYLGRQMMSR